MSACPLNPTFRGYIASTMDALILFEACLSGHLFHVPRRPHDRERAGLIVSGNVFIYEEHSSGIKRWTDGVPWSPSRILGNFLLYRELDKPFQPGEKKRAMKRTKAEAGVTKPVSNSRSNSVGNGVSSNALANAGTSMTNFDGMTNSRNETERALVGSLIDSYQFKPEGLVKKTISVTYQGIQHHMVSYYNIDDVVGAKLTTPSHDPSLRGITPRAPLISSGSFRAPVDDHEVMMAEPHFRNLVNMSHSYNGYHMNGAGPRSMSMPSFAQPAWGAPEQYVPSYTMAPTLPPPVAYAPPPASSYNYDSNGMTPYGMTPRSSVGFPQQTHLSARRHSNLHATNGVGQIDYSNLGHVDRPQLGSTHILSNGGNLGSHSLASHPSYSNGTVFESSAAAAAATANAASHSNHHLSGRHSATFDSQLDNGFDTRGTHHGTTEFGTSIADHGTHNLSSSSQDTTPPTMHMSLENSGSASNVGTEAAWANDFMSSEGFPQ
ncbi:Gti1/Pac2 family-domain-containing protein [Jackrogersella minutella]|nr:Gti1/Pac2 family-domain-containing protein [Jackrogersella minutella]